MDIKYLQYFNEIMKEGNLTRAALNLNIAQPALSATIRRMEKELDVNLFDKNGRNIVPSPYALEILPHVENILAQYEAALQKITHMKNPQKHNLCLAVTGMAFPHPLLLAFSKTHPNIAITQRLFNPNRFSDIFQNDETDCIISAYPFTDKRLEQKTLWQEKIVIVVPQNHRFAFRQSLSVAELRNENFIMLPSDYAFRILCERICTDAGFIPTITMECFPGQTRALVSSGFGIAFLTPASVLSELSPGDGVCAIPLADPHCVRDITLLWKKNKELSKSAKKFVRFATGEFQYPYTNA